MFVQIDINGNRAFYNIYGEAEDIARALQEAAEHHPTLRTALNLIKEGTAQCKCGKLSQQECDYRCIGSAFIQPSEQEARNRKSSIHYQSDPDFIETVGDSNTPNNDDKK